MSTPSEQTLALLTRIANGVEALEKCFAILANRLASAPSPTAGGTGPVLRFGRSKGKHVSEATTGDLQWVAEKVRESIDDPEIERYREQNAELLSAIEAELEKR